MKPSEFFLNPAIRAIKEINMDFSKLTFKTKMFGIYVNLKFHPNNHRKLYGEPMIRVRALKKAYKNRRKNYGSSTRK